MEEEMDESNQTPNWQPISFLPQIAEMIDGMLESAQEVHDSLQQARTRPHVMDDYTLGRVREVHGIQLNELWVYEEQLSRWRKDSPTERQQREIERLTEQLSALRQVFTLCLALADEMKNGTIDQILAKDDVELAIEFLMGKRKL
jgi:predicted ATPase